MDVVPFNLVKNIIQKGNSQCFSRRCTELFCPLYVPQKVAAITRYLPQLFPPSTFTSLILKARDGGSIFILEDAYSSISTYPVLREGK
jgi:hypothetical protein